MVRLAFSELIASDKMSAFLYDAKKSCELRLGIEIGETIL